MGFHEKSDQCDCHWNNFEQMQQDAAGLASRKIPVNHFLFVGEIP